MKLQFTSQARNTFYKTRNVNFFLTSSLTPHSQTILNREATFTMHKIILSLPSSFSSLKNIKKFALVYFFFFPCRLISALHLDFDLRLTNYAGETVVHLAAMADNTEDCLNLLLAEVNKHSQSIFLGVSVLSTSEMFMSGVILLIFIQSCKIFDKHVNYCNT